MLSQQLTQHLFRSGYVQLEVVDFFTRGLVPGCRGVDAEYFASFAVAAMTKLATSRHLEDTLYATS
jgi:hypothetical protein